MDMYGYAHDPLAGWVEPWTGGRCTKLPCECDDHVGAPLCEVCADEWAAMLADAEIYPERADDEPEDPWLAEQRDPEADEVDDDHVWAQAAEMDEEPTDA